MKKEMILSSIMATSLVAPGSSAWASDHKDGNDDPMDVVKAANNVRLASAAEYTAYHSDDLADWKSVSVLLAHPGGPGQDLYNLYMGLSDLEMVIRTADIEGGSDEYGNGQSDDVYFYLKFLTSFNEGKNKTYLGFTCNSSQSCTTGETFIVNVDDDELRISSGKYGPTDGYLPAFVKGPVFKLKKS